MTPETHEFFVFQLLDLTSSSAKRRFRQSIKAEFDHTCAYCGRSHEDNGNALSLTIDHVRPRAHGGSSLRSNLVPACRRCNNAKGSIKNWRDWYEQQEFYCPDRASRIEAWLEPIPSPLELGYGWAGAA